MQFLRVWAKDRGFGTMINDIPVLINGEANGVTGAVIKLDGGWIEVSVDFHKAQTSAVPLEGTTFDFPMEVVILVGEADMLSPHNGLEGLHV